MQCEHKTIHGKNLQIGPEHSKTVKCVVAREFRAMCPLVCDRVLFMRRQKNQMNNGHQSVEKGIQLTSEGLYKRCGSKRNLRQEHVTVRVSVCVFTFSRR